MPSFAESVIFFLHFLDMLFLYLHIILFQELHRVGHEIGVFSITNNNDAKYWTEGNYDTWLGEMAGAR